MKAGYNVGLDRNKQRIVVGTEYQMMEEFMEQFHIESSQDVISNIQDKDEAKRLQKDLTKSLVYFFHGSIDPKLVPIVRNTSLFEMRGMEMGDFDGDLRNISLMEYVYHLQEGTTEELIGKLRTAEEKAGGTDDAQKDLSDEYLKKVDDTVKDINEYKRDLVDELAKDATIDAEGDVNVLQAVRIDRHTISEIKDIKNFMYAGNSTFTIQNTETQNRFTYKIQVPEDKKNASPIDKVWFVKVLNGTDNENSYAFIGTLFSDKTKMSSDDKIYRHSGKSRVTNQAQSVKVFQWFIKALQTNTIPSQVQFYHEGRCGRCGRKLTVPESIESGFGPECINMI